MLERIFAIVICMISAGIYYCTTQFNMDFIGTTGVGPAFFPKIICVILFCLGVALFISNLRTHFKAEVKNVKYTILVMIVFTVYIFLISRLGYLVSTILFAFAIINILKDTSLKVKVIFSIVFPVCLYLLFTYVFKVSLPEGILI